MVQGTYSVAQPSDGRVPDAPPPNSELALPSARGGTARPVQLSVRGPLATITIDNPPVNALGHSVRAGLWAALDAIGGQPAVRAVLIRAAGRTWPAGADIREFGQASVPPSLADICDRIAGFDRPVTAVLCGTALGGGLELALAATARLAVAGTSLGLPEVTLGLCPGAGGTQRLPRLIGAKAALGMMLSGLPVHAERAVEIGLIDGIIDGGGQDSAADIAAALAVTLADTPARVTPARETAAQWLQAVAEARAGLGGQRLPAPGRIVTCVEAALLLPPAQAAMVERTAFSDLRDTPESRGLRHAFMAERQAARHPRLAGVVPRPVGKVTISGDGVTAAGLATALLDAGLAVTLAGDSGETVAAGLARIAAAQEEQLAVGRTTAEQREADWARLRGAVGAAAFASADMGIVVGSRLPDEARGAADNLPAGAVLVLADDAAAITAAAAASGRGADVTGLIWGEGPGAERLAEVVAPTGADAAAVAATLWVVRQTGRLGAVVREPVGARLLRAVQQAADIVLHLGASPYDIDRAMTGWGFAAGAYAMRDRLGASPGAQGSPTARALADAMAARGWDGQAAGQGFYRHGPAGGGGDARAGEAEVLAMLRASRDAVARERGELSGRPVARLSAAAVMRHMLAALANEGARLVTAEVAARPSDVDAVALHRIGFPRWRGGPMLAADEAGLLTLRAALRDQERSAGTHAAPLPLWDDLIRNGQGFGSLNGV